MDEYARIIHQLDNATSLAGNQYIVTFGMTLRDPNDNADNQASNTSGRYLIKNAALQGGGKYYDTTSPTSLQTAITRLLAEIQGVNSTFVSATLPVALNVSNTYLNQVYMGLFRPDANLGPRWAGNLKRYKLRYDAGDQSLTLVDNKGVEAVSVTTGFIVPTAWSKWTENPTTGEQWYAGSVDFWKNSMRGSPLPSATDGPDGEVVEKGGAAQRLREQFLVNAAISGAAGYGDRKVLTCTLNSSCTPTCSGAPAKFDLASIAASNATCQAKFGAAGTAELQSIVNWARGIDNGVATESGPGLTTWHANVTVRGSVHGDVLHSRPQIINYGAGDGEGIVAFYGGNDGMLHAACVGNSGEDRGWPAVSRQGQEMWSFVAPESSSGSSGCTTRSPWSGCRTSTSRSSRPRRSGATTSSTAPSAPVKIRMRRASVTVIYRHVRARRGGDLHLRRSMSPTPTIRVAVAAVPERSTAPPPGFGRSRADLVAAAGGLRAGQGQEQPRALLRRGLLRRLFGLRRRQAHRRRRGFHRRGNRGADLSVGGERARRLRGRSRQRRHVHDADGAEVLPDQLGRDLHHRQQRRRRRDPVRPRPRRLHRPRLRARHRRHRVADGRRR